jgi:predicted amidophosphoribosyltransferase
VGSTGWGRLAEALAAAVDLVLPATCAVCADAGGPVCAACRRDVRECALAAGSERIGWARPPPGMPPCWASARFEGALRTAVTAYKDDGRRDLRPLLADGLAVAFAVALSGEEALRAVAGRDRVLVVPMPTSPGARRRRGDDPVGDLVRAAVDRVRAGDARALAVAPVLEHVRAVADQSHLGRTERQANLAGAMRVAPAARPLVRGSVFVLADDVVTTGATLAEAGRALRDAGARHVVAVAVAATASRFPVGRGTASAVPLVSGRNPG